MIETYIGIDPGEHNGVAVYDKKNGLRLYTLSFWQLIELIDTMNVKDKTLQEILPKFFIENPGLNSFIYRQKVDHKAKSAATRIAKNVGQNIGDAKRIIERVKQHGMICCEIKPISSSAKWDAALFNALLRGRFEITHHNQHVRDAAKLISQYWTL